MSFNLAEHCGFIARKMRRRAAVSVCDGRPDNDRRVISRCRAMDSVLGVGIVFTRDTGHHTSGWLRNPDYERCWHLSLSCPSGVSRDVRWAYLRAFFTPDEIQSSLFEGPKSRDGVVFGVQHWRVFADPDWRPLLPRGEVYHSTWTPPDWRSASQVAAEDLVVIESPLGVDP